MLSNLTARDRRTVLVGGVAILTLLALFRGLPAWRTWRDQTRLSARRVMTRAQRTDTTLAVLPLSLDSLQAQVQRLVAISAELQPGTTPAAVTSTFRSLIWDMAHASGVRLNVTHIRLDSASHGPLPRIELKATAKADIIGLASFLRRLEGNTALVSIQSLTVRAEDPQGASNTPERLAIKLTVDGLGFVQPDSAKSQS